MLRTLFIVAILQGYLSRAILPSARLHLWKGNKVSFELCNICAWCAKRIQRTRISKYKRGELKIWEQRERGERGELSWEFVDWGAKLCVSSRQQQLKVAEIELEIIYAVDVTRFNGRSFEIPYAKEKSRMNKTAFPNEHFFPHERNSREKTMILKTMIVMDNSFN